MRALGTLLFVHYLATCGQFGVASLPPPLFLSLSVYIVLQLAVYCMGTRGVTAGYGSCPVPNLNLVIKIREYGLDG